MLTEKDMEDAVAKDPERYLGEASLKLISRQHHIGSYVFDLLFEDRHGGRLIVELQRGTRDRVHTYKILDYYHEYKSSHPREFVDLMVVANQIPPERKQRLTDSGIAFREIPVSEFPETAALLTRPVIMGEEETQDTSHPEQLPSLNKENRMPSENYNDFWCGFLDKVEPTGFFRDAPPSQKQLKRSFLGRPVKGLSGVSLLFVVSKTRNEAWVELCIERKTSEESKGIMRSIREAETKIVRDLGETLEWDDLKPDRKRCKIMSKKPRILFEMDQKEQWGEVQTSLVNRMIRFQAALSGRCPLPVNL